MLASAHIRLQILFTGMLYKRCFYQYENAVREPDKSCRFQHTGVARRWQFAVLHLHWSDCFLLQAADPGAKASDRERSTCYSYLPEATKGIHYCLHSFRRSRFGLPTRAQFFSWNSWGTENEKEHSQDNPQLVHVVERNIPPCRSIARKKELKIPWSKIADKIIRFPGSRLFVYLHLALFGTWIFGAPDCLAKSFRFFPGDSCPDCFSRSDFSFHVCAHWPKPHECRGRQKQRTWPANPSAGGTWNHRLIALVTAMAKKMNIESANDAESEELPKDAYPEKWWRQWRK